MPSGTRTTALRRGGVTPLMYCGFNSNRARTVVSARSAMTSSPVASGTVISSKTNGGYSGIESNPKRSGAFASSAAAISFGTDSYQRIDLEDQNPPFIGDDRSWSQRADENNTAELGIGIDGDGLTGLED